MAEVVKEYGDSSITALKGADRVRKRVNVMFGTNNVDGAFHTVFEIIGNSLDECRAGFGNRVEVTYDTDKTITVRDYGRGVPMGWNEKEQRYNWDLIFNELYAGGKMDVDSAYKYSIGLNGLGAAATQYTSEVFDVVSYTKDKTSSMHFEKGNPAGELKVENVHNDVTGTIIKWKVDDEVFSSTDFTVKMFRDCCETLAHVSGVTIVLDDNIHNVHEEYVGTTLHDYLASKVGKREVESYIIKDNTSGIDEKNRRYKAECEIVLMVTDEMSPVRMFFHNTGTMRNIEGYHHKAFAMAVSDFFKEIGRNEGIKIQPRDYEDYLSCIVSTYSNVVDFYNQTKDAVSNMFIYNLIYNTIKRRLDLEYAKHNESILAFVKNVVVAAQARVRAKQIEQAEKQVKKQITGVKRVKAEKFKDCAERDPRKRELYIVEGDSALGACKLARDSKFQALIPVQGKILNCLKASIERILENKVITDLTSTIGTGIDLGTSNLFNINKLQFNKIIICTDADVDGFQIRVLLYTMFYRLMPELLRTGHVYIADTPLFEIVTGNNESHFAFNVEEKEQMLADFKNRGIRVKQINRSKGLGENTPEMMRKTTMLPESRKLIPLTIDVQDEIVRELSNVLFGNDYNKQRKEFVKELLGVQLAELVDEIEILTDEDRNMEDTDNQ